MAFSFNHFKIQSIKRPVSSPLCREWMLFSPIYFFFALINLRAKLCLTPAWFNGHLAHNHEKLLAFQYTNNEQSRLLQFYIPELFHRLLSLSVEHAYIVQRLLFIFLAFMLFHHYLRRWFHREGALAGVAILAAVMPLAYFNDLQESAPLLSLTFLLSLWGIRDTKIFLILVSFFIGGLNNETMLILPLVYFAYHFSEWKCSHLGVLILKTCLISLPVVLTVGTIRYINWDRPPLGSMWNWSYNVNGILSAITNFPSEVCFLYMFIIFGAFWAYAFMDFKSKPLFLRRASFMIPFFIIAHLVRGFIWEARYMIPLAFIVIPMGLFFVFAHEPPIESQKTGNPELPHSGT